MDNDPNQRESSSYEQQPPPFSQRPTSQDEQPQQPPLYESPPLWVQQPPPQYRQPPDGPPQPPKKRSLLWLWITLALVGGIVLGCIGSAIVVALTLSSFARLERPVTPFPTFPSSFPGSVPTFPGSFSGSGSREIIAGSDGALWFTEQDGDKIGRITTQGTITQFTITTNPLYFFSF